MRPRRTGQSRTSKCAATDYALMCSNLAHASLLVVFFILAATGTTWHCNADSQCFHSRPTDVDGSPSFQADSGHCLTEHATSMTRGFGIVGLDVAGMESSTSPCQRPPDLLLSAPCSCRLLAELAGWRLQHKGYQTHHGDGGPTAAWLRQAKDYHHGWGTPELFLL